MLQRIWQKLSKPAGASKSFRVFYLVGTKVILLSGSFKAGQLHCECTEHVLADNVFPDNLLPLLAMQPAGSDVAMVLDAQRYQLLPLDKPKLSAEEIVQALPWLIKDICNLAPDDMQLDYLDIPGSPATPRINIVVTSKSALQQLCKDLLKHKLTPKLIAPQEWLTMELMPADALTRLLLLQQAGQPMQVQVIREGQLCFSRQLRGFDQFSDTSIEQLQYGLLDNLLLEMQRSMDFVESQLKLPPVREMLLMLAHPQLDEVVTLFKKTGFNQAKAIQLPAALEWASSLNAITCWPAIAAMQQLAFAKEPKHEAAG